MENRNLYGFALFTMIIITTVLIKFALITPVMTTAKPLPTATNCFPKRIVTTASTQEQAVLNLNSKVFDVNLDLSKQSNFSAEKGYVLALDFYVKDNQPRRIATETVNISYNDLKNFGDTQNVHLICSSAWLNQIILNQTLYVMPRLISSTQELTQPSLSFNDAQAVPVLIVGSN